MLALELTDALMQEENLRYELFSEDMAKLESKKSKSALKKYLNKRLLKFPNNTVYELEENKNYLNAYPLHLHKNPNTTDFEAIAPAQSDPAPQIPHKPQKCSLL